MTVLVDLNVVFWGLSRISDGSQEEWPSRISMHDPQHKVPVCVHLKRLAEHRLRHLIDFDFRDSCCNRSIFIDFQHDLIVNASIHKSSSMMPSRLLLAIICDSPDPQPGSQWRIRRRTVLQVFLVVLCTFKTR